MENQQLEHVLVLIQIGFDALLQLHVDVGIRISVKVKLVVDIAACIFSIVNGFPCWDIDVRIVLIQLACRQIIVACGHSTNV